jgi:hypothetical protein
MQSIQRTSLGILSIFLLLLFSCTKSETILVGDNDPPIVNNVPAIKIENYVNRVFIDLLGREPLDTEMAFEAQQLRDAQLSQSARLALIQKLQTDTEIIPGDSTYQIAYHQQFYNLGKAHFLEGVSDATIANEFLGNAEDPDEIEALQNLLDCRDALRLGTISLSEFMSRMVYNSVYDVINMNTFNFVNATFDNLFWRFPTQSEFQAGFAMVEYATEETLLGQTGTSKVEYVDILTQSLEFYEGMIILVYQQLLSRRPNSAETAALLVDFSEHQDIRLIQQAIMVTDEYAGF